MLLSWLHQKLEKTQIVQLWLIPSIIFKTTNYGHFGKNDADITWEKTDKAAALKKAALAAAKL